MKWVDANPLRTAVTRGVQAYFSGKSGGYYTAQVNGIVDSVMEQITAATDVIMQERDAAVALYGQARSDLAEAGLTIAQMQKALAAVIKERDVLGVRVVVLEEMLCVIANEAFQDFREYLGDQFWAEVDAVVTHHAITAHPYNPSP